MRSFLFFFVLLIAACDGENKKPSAPTSTFVDPPKLETFEPPTAREATPLKVLDMRLRNKVGIFEMHGVKKDLVGFGVNLCQTGYYLQGFVRNDGRLEATPALLISRATIPTTPFTYRAAESDGKSIVFDLSRFSLDYIAGEIAVKDGSGTPVMTYTLDGEPTTVGNSKGLGNHGCFSTGEFSIALKTSEATNENGRRGADPTNSGRRGADPTNSGRRGADPTTGPVTAMFDGHTFYVVIMQLTERHQVLWQIDLRPHQRKTGALIRGDLDRLLKEPNKFPFRMSFITRRDDPTAEPSLVSDEIPATHGSLTAAWQTDGADGPIKLQVLGLKMPKWDGPWSEQDVDLTMIAKFVTDPNGVRVPRPATLQ